MEGVQSTLRDTPSASVSGSVAPEPRKAPAINSIASVQPRRMIAACSNAATPVSSNDSEAMTSLS